MNKVRKLIVVASRDEAVIETIHNIGVTYRIGTANVSMGSSCVAMLRSIKSSHQAQREEIVTVVVMDEDLGDTRGDVLLKRLAMEYPESKFIFLMDRPTVEMEAKVRGSGAYFFLAKPIVNAVMARIVTKAFEHETTRIMAMSG